MGKRILLYGGAAAAVLAVVIVVAVLLYLRQFSRPGEATAQVIPADAPLYASINLRPGLGQLGLGRDVFSRLQTDALVEKRDELLEQVEDETGIHFLDDVTTWLGTDISFAILDADMDKIEWVLLVQVSDRDSAAEFVEHLVSYLEDLLDTDFDSETHEGVDLWTNERRNEEVALALTDDYMLMGDSRDTVQDMVRNLKSPPSNSLAEDEAFIAARESAPAQRVMFTFARAELVDPLVEAADPFGAVESSLSAVRRRIALEAPEYIAAATSFVENGIRMDLVAETPSGDFATDIENSLRSATVLPQDTLVLYSQVGLSQVWEESRSNLDSDLNEFLLDVLEGFKDETGVDLEGDVIGSLTGEFALALLPSEFRLDQFGQEGGTPGTIEALLLAEVDSSGSMAHALDTLVGILEDQGLEIDRQPLGSYEAVTAGVDEFLEDLFGTYRPGYVVTEDWAVMGSNIDGLKAFHDAATGASDTLHSAAEFDRLAGMAPTPLHNLFFMDIAGVTAMVENALADEARDAYLRNVKVFVESLSAFMFAGSTADDRMQFIAMLTLRE